MAHLYLPEKLTLLTWGDLGHVFQISDGIALKYSTTKGDPRFENENRVFDELERHPYCPHLIYSFIRLPDVNFMQYLPGGNLETRFRTRQRRDPITGQVLEVYGAEAEPLILRWMKELSSAAAWLESLGLAHGDIRPPNILLDALDHLKLADFDNTMAIGTEVEVGTAPYARVLGDEAGAQRGTFGFLSARTEQFAVGSVFYYMTRGFEPYDDEWYGDDHGPVTVDMLQLMEFPHTDTRKQKDSIIRKCWYSEFHSMKALAATVESLACPEDEAAREMAPEFIKARQKECRQLVADGLLATILVTEPSHKDSGVSVTESIALK